MKKILLALFLLSVFQASNVVDAAPSKNKNKRSHSRSSFKQRRHRSRGKAGTHSRGGPSRAATRQQDTPAADTQIQTATPLQALEQQARQNPSECIASVYAQYEVYKALPAQNAIEVGADQQKSFQNFLQQNYKDADKASEMIILAAANMIEAEKNAQNAAPAGPADDAKRELTTKNHEQLVAITQELQKLDKESAEQNALQPKLPQPAPVQSVSADFNPLETNTTDLAAVRARETIRAFVKAENGQPNIAKSAENAKEQDKSAVVNQKTKEEKTDDAKAQRAEIALREAMSATRNSRGSGGGSSGGGGGGSSGGGSSGGGDRYIAPAPVVFYANNVAQEREAEERRQRQAAEQARIAAERAAEQQRQRDAVQARAAAERARKEREEEKRQREREEREAQEEQARRDAERVAEEQRQRDAAQAIAEEERQIAAGERRRNPDPITERQLMDAIKELAASGEEDEKQNEGEDPDEESDEEINSKIVNLNKEINAIQTEFNILAQDESTILGNRTLSELNVRSADLSAIVEANNRSLDEKNKIRIDLQNLEDRKRNDEVALQNELNPITRNEIQNRISTYSAELASLKTLVDYFNISPQEVRANNVELNEIEEILKQHRDFLRRKFLIQKKSNNKIIERNILLAKIEKNRKKRARLSNENSAINYAQLISYGTKYKDMLMHECKDLLNVVATSSADDYLASDEAASYLENKYAGKQDFTKKAIKHLAVAAVKQWSQLDENDYKDPQNVFNRMISDSSFSSNYIISKLLINYFNENEMDKMEDMDKTNKLVTYISTHCMRLIDASLNIACISDAFMRNELDIIKNDGNRYDPNNPDDVETYTKFMDEFERGGDIFIRNDGKTRELRAEAKKFNLEANIRLLNPIQNDRNRQNLDYDDAGYRKELNSRLFMRYTQNKLIEDWK